MDERLRACPQQDSRGQIGAQDNPDIGTVFHHWAAVAAAKADILDGKKQTACHQNRSDQCRAAEQPLEIHNNIVLCRCHQRSECVIAHRTDN